MKKFIAIAGNIGAGKTTLTKLLSGYLCWEPFFEAVHENPYLTDFYKDMQTWSFHSQMYFLAKRLSRYRQMIERSRTIIQDRTVYEDAEIFAQNLHVIGRMTLRDWESYWELYQTVITILPPPDLVIYLQTPVSVLQDRIRQRGNESEQHITAEYLEQINYLYESWIQRFSLCPVLTVPTESLNFIDTNSHLELIANRVLEKLYGKEVMTFSE